MGSPEHLQANFALRRSSCFSARLGLTVLQVVADALEKEIEEELLDAKLCISPVLSVELLLVEFDFRHDTIPSRRFLALLHLSSQRLKSSILLIHDVFESGEELVSEWLGQLWNLHLCDESTLLRL